MKTTDDLPQTGDEDATAPSSRVSALAQLLATGATQSQAAAVFGVGDRTIRRWLAQDGVSSEIRRYEEEHFARLGAGIVDLGHRALNVVRELLESEDPRIRLRAASVSLTATGVRGDAAIAIRLRDELRALAHRPNDPWGSIEQPTPRPTRPQAAPPAQVQGTTAS